jgi:TatD DNase family protein
MIDSHAHLSLCEPDTGELLGAAARAGVGRVLDIGLDEVTNRAAIEAAEDFEAVFASVGRHPNSAGGFDEAAALDIAALAAGERVRAIGETGLDYYRDGAPRAEQMSAFRAQIEIAREVSLPLVIHVRDPAGETGAVDDAFATLDSHGAGVSVILHCFSAPQRVGDAAERGWYCSFAGNVTYPSAEDLRAAAAQVPDDLLLVETDSPFLSPQAVRGKPNQPANVVSTAAAVAAARGTEPAELEAVLDRNAARLFGW